jgi:CDP-glycerol glycerophosphotransferase (TagB/SpsB family)
MVFEKMNLLLKKLFYLLDLLIPKKKRIVFSSFPDLSDNAFALFEFMLNDVRLKNYSFVWLTEKEPSNYLTFNKPNIFIIKKNSLKGIYFYLSSSIAFYTHGLYKNISSYNKKKRINLWHGMPFKKIGILDDNFKGIVPTQDKLIVTSLKCAQIYSEPFNISLDNILQLGQSRNDFLKKETFFFKKRGIDLSEYDKVIVWLPTYKKSNIGVIREDGVFNENKIGFLERNKLNELDSFLSNKNIFLILKLHPMDVFNEEVFCNLENILIIKNKDLEESKEQLYPILGLTDALITDFSSVFIDYLLIDKPIAFDLSDFENYNKNRGFLIKNPKKVLTGNTIYNYEDLKTFINNVYDEKDDYKQEREKNKKMFHNYYDYNSSKRITDWMLNELI